MSSMRVFAPPQLYEALKAEGLCLPDECGDVHMTMPVDGLMQLHYTVNLRPEDLVKIGRALEKIGTRPLEKIGTSENIEAWHG